MILSKLCSPCTQTAMPGSRTEADFKSKSKEDLQNPAMACIRLATQVHMHGYS